MQYPNIVARKIKKIYPHNNADNLDVVEFREKTIVVPKNRYKIGDLVGYIPVGTEVSVWTGDPLFSILSEKPEWIRIKPRKFRGLVSEGFIFPIDNRKYREYQNLLVDFDTILPDIFHLTESDLNKILQVKGFVPLIDQFLVFSNRVSLLLNTDPSFKDLQILSKVFRTNLIDRVFEEDKKGCPSCGHGALKALELRWE